MGNFEKLSVLVIVIIIVMILVVALHTWSEKPGEDEAGKPPLDNVVNTAGDDDWSDPATIPLGGDTLPPLNEGEGAESENEGADDPLEVGFDVVNDDGTQGGEADPEPADEGPREYTVQPRDTLSHIAQRECGSIRFVSEIMALNPGVDPSALRVGSKLKLPGGNTSSTRDAPGGDATTPTPGPSGPAKPGGTYTTRAGDTFERISKRVYGTIEKWPAIWAANVRTVPDADRIPAGTLLQLPK